MMPTYSLFPNEWITFAVFLAGIFALIGLSELARVKLQWSPEASRKFVHILVGVLVLLTPFLFVSKGPPVVLAVIFIAVNLVSVRSDKLAGMHSAERKSYGTVYFPVAYLILCLFWWERQIPFLIALLLLTFADTAAAAIGESVRNPEHYRPWRDEKTIQGSLMMAVTSALLTGIGTRVFRNVAGLEPLDLQVLIPLSLLVAALATIAEAVSKEGSDNLSVPIVSAVGFDLYFDSVQKGEVMGLLLWILLSFALAQGAFMLRALRTDGALGAFVIGVFVFGIGGWKFVMPMGVFFVISSLLSKIGKEAKESRRQSFGKGSQRDVVQVFANGGVPLLLTIWWFYRPSDVLFTAYLASVAAATADTWATEIGFFSRGSPRSSVTVKRVEPGASGGVTLLGSAGALLGAVAIAAAGWLYLGDVEVARSVVLAGFAANLFDSVLGSTVQASYLCSKCNRSVEVAEHCDGTTTLQSGTALINNDMVNLLCTLSGGAIILLMA